MTRRFTRTITSANIDRLRFTFGVQALVETTSKGDRNPSEVRLLVQIQRNGGWVTEKDITIKGKTTSQYLASVVVDNLPPRPFNIRMRRMTPDSTTDQLQNKTLWSSYTEIIDVKQCYPNTALVGVQVDSEQFGSQQVSRNYHLRGRILQVPSNYNPQTRQYSGIWDGTFKPAYSKQHGLVSVGYADPSAATAWGNVLVRQMWINGRCMSSARIATSQCRTALAARSRASPVMRT
ncbi:TipJ family phage tail tip protein [Escherichia coli]|uniref:TipJ family phage tail tip protein n=1 Tax=Escherichia coli TaxID=562 RepID=UPI003B599262